jgi:SAM-dependent methyltransferase
MVGLRRFSDILDAPRVYALWQAPFARSKLVPWLRHNELASMRRVLDVGCGPGTNSRYFQHADYLGIDLNPRYVEHARRVHGREFLAVDACTYQPAAGERYDCIFLNSFLHHIDDENCGRILRRLHDVLSADGHIHILDLVLPERPSAARWLARHDRGNFARPLATWRGMFGEVFEPVVFEPHALRAFGCHLWQMIYFKGRAKA